MMIKINHIKNGVMPLNTAFIAVSPPHQTDLTNSWRTKREVTMYDPNLKLREHAYMKNSDLTTWPDMVRQNRDADVDPRLYKVHHESLVFPLVAGLAGGLLRLLRGLLSLPGRLMRHKQNKLPMERHLPAGQ
jgi:hypothetical protein